MSIKAKIILANVIVFGMVLIAVAVFVYNSTRQSEIAKLDSQLEVFATGFITEFEDEWESGDFPDGSELQSGVPAGLSEIRIELIDTSGNIIFSRGSLPVIGIGTIQSRLAGIPKFENIQVDDTELRQLIQPMEVDEKPGFVLRLAAPMADLESRLNNLIAVLILSIPIALLLSALAVYFITRLAFKPMTRMVETAEQISASSLHHRIELPARKDEVRRLADALNEMIDRIEDAFKSQRQFVSDASHELRTPLTVIYSELEYLKRGVERDELQDGIAATLSETDRLSRLVDQLLLLSRIDARKLILDLQPIRLDELLAEITRLLQTQVMARNIRLNLHIEEALEITGDTEKLKRVLINIAENAIKYSPPEGQVFISLEKINDIAALIKIRDQGPGISDEDMPNIFKRFFRGSTARANHEGSGLGLAIARELVDAMGGKIAVSSEPGKGTTVKISLPFKG